ncbi:MAG: hypothetical protein ACRELF_14625 [Gemmataceae bacterium]
MNSVFARLLSLICLAWLAMAARADNRAAPIRDDAGLFHADARARAEQRIDDIRQEFHRNLFVQTVASASPRQRRLFPFLRTPEVNRLLEEQARNYADELGLPGIYVVICKQPRDVHVIVRPSDGPEFTPHDAEKLRRMLARRRWDDSGSDSALLGLVEQVHSILQDHATPGAAHSEVNEFVLAGLLVGGLALWILLAMIRFKMRAARAATAGDEDAAMQARGAPALFGAMFGFPAGLWIYDKLYPCPSGSPLPLCVPEPNRRDACSTVSSTTGVPPVESVGDAEEYPREEYTEDVPVSP